MEEGQRMKLARARPAKARIPGPESWLSEEGPSVSSSSRSNKSPSKTRTKHSRNAGK
jgi:hypothetical protein